EDGIRDRTVTGVQTCALPISLFFRSKADTTRDIEIDAAAEPGLFAFLHRIADQAGAPRPHRVFLSSRVNAGVSYDFSILNLIFRSEERRVGKECQSLCGAVEC